MNVKLIFFFFCALLKEKTSIESLWDVVGGLIHTFNSKKKKKSCSKQNKKLFMLPTTKVCNPRDFVDSHIQFYNFFCIIHSNTKRSICSLCLDHFVFYTTIVSLHFITLMSHVRLWWMKNWNGERDCTLKLICNETPYKIEKLQMHHFLVCNFFFYTG